MDHLNFIQTTSVPPIILCSLFLLIPSLTYLFYSGLIIHLSFTNSFPSGRSERPPKTSSPAHSVHSSGKHFCSLSAISRSKERFEAITSCADKPLRKCQSTGRNELCWRENKFRALCSRLPPVSSQSCRFNRRKRVNLETQTAQNSETLVLSKPWTCFGAHGKAVLRSVR